MRLRCCLCRRGIANFGSRFIGPFTTGIRPYFAMPCGLCRQSTLLLKTAESLSKVQWQPSWRVNWRRTLRITYPGFSKSATNCESITDRGPAVIVCSSHCLLDVCGITGHLSRPLDLVELLAWRPPAESIDIQPMFHPACDVPTHEITSLIDVEEACVGRAREEI